MRKRVKLGLITGVALVALTGGAVAFATSESDENVTGPRADRAVEAALAETGGGTANSVELDSGNGATWEVEVTKPNGDTVDVRLDDAYRLVVIEGDTE
jgi:uncharacterized membrane protein YkoI